jgi:hypothetical protein
MQAVGMATKTTSNTAAAPAHGATPLTVVGGRPKRGSRSLSRMKDNLQKNDLRYANPEMSALKLPKIDARETISESRTGRLGDQTLASRPRVPRRFAAMSFR